MMREDRKHNITESKKWHTCNMKLQEDPCLQKVEPKLLPTRYIQHSDVFTRFSGYKEI